MASFTITEKDTAFMMEKGELLSVVESGFNDKPENQQHLMGRVAALCYRRFKTCKSQLPFPVWTTAPTMETN